MRIYSKGFTIIELLLVVSIISIAGLAVIPVSSNFLVKSSKINKLNEIISVVKTAQLNSISGKGGSKWGIKITGSKIILFKGDSYDLRDSAFDQKFDIPSGITVTESEIVFDKVTGNASFPSVISIDSDTSQTTQLIINQVGTVDVVNEHE